MAPYVKMARYLKYGNGSNCQKEVLSHKGVIFEKTLHDL